MSKLIWIVMSGMLAVAVLAMCVPCTAIADDDDEEAVAIKDLPKAVVEAVMKALKACPGCTLVSAEKETEDDGIEYEIKVKLKCGKVVEVEVEVAKDGTIKKVEIEDDKDEENDDNDGHEDGHKDKK